MKIAVAIDSFKGSLSSRGVTTLSEALNPQNAYKNLKATATQVFRLMLL